MYTQGIQTTMPRPADSNKDDFERESVLRLALLAQDIRLARGGRGRVEWCGRGDSNPYGLATASPSSWFVLTSATYEFEVA